MLSTFLALKELSFNANVTEVFGKWLFFSFFSYCAVQTLIFNTLNVFIDINPLHWFTNYWNNLVTLQFYVNSLLLLAANLFEFGACSKFFYYERYYNTRFRYMKRTFCLSIFYLISCLYQSILNGTLFANIPHFHYKEASYFFHAVCLWTVVFLNFPDSVFRVQPNAFSSLEFRKFVPDIFDMFRLISRSFKSSLQIYWRFVFIYSLVWFMFFDFPLNISSLFHGWLLTMFLILSKFILNLSLDFFLVRRINFSVVVNVQHNSPFLLRTAITSNIPLLRYLGYNDLLLLSKSKKRIKELFYLDQPGCYSSTWKCISEEIISFINRITEELKGATCVKPQFNIQLKMYNAGMSNPPQFLNKPAMQKSDNLVTSVKTFLFKFKIVSYLFEELPETDFVNILQEHSQCLSLACESLSNIVYASLTEDTHGVVQKNLTEIIRSLLQLYGQLKRSDVPEFRMAAYPEIKFLKQSLSYSVSSSIYMIALAFRPHVRNLRLSPEEKDAFLSFIR